MSTPISSPDSDLGAVPLRLQKFLARAGVASRRGSEDLMTAGRVTVNGQVVTELGAKVNPKVDVVAVDGTVVDVFDSGPVYLALNKPVGYITTMSDPHGRPTVAELIDGSRYPGLFPVGRLDQDTSGLLLFTTDGEMSHRILHPRWKVYKTYIVEVDGRPRDAALEELRTGVALDDGMTSPAMVRVLEYRDSSAVLEMQIREGRKRQVRRMCLAVHHPVLTLRRTVFGPVELGDLAEGSVRDLSADEVRALRAAVGLEDAQ